MTKHEPAQAQPGVTATPSEHLLLVAMTLNAADPASCHAALENLRSLVAAELKGIPAIGDAETGELGFAAKHKVYDLMITVGFSTAAYAKLGAAPAQMPLDLHPMPADIFDASGQGRGPRLVGEGDVLLRITSDDSFVAEHVLRRVEQELAAAFSITWVQTGSQRFDLRQSENPRNESRALIGFQDGTANLDPSKPEDRALIFTDHTVTTYPPNPTSDTYNGAAFPELRPVPSGSEPAELDGGTYLAIEVLTINTAAFDQLNAVAQSAIVGRDKATGAPAAPPDPGSHIQKANPHRQNTDDDSRRLLRRGYPLIQGGGVALERGLIFMAFARSLTTQHEFVRRAWINNPNFPQRGGKQDELLFGFVNTQIECGGYYFVPPLKKMSDPASWIVPSQA